MIHRPSLERLGLRVRAAPFEPAYGLLGRLAIRHGYLSSQKFIVELSLGIPNLWHDIVVG